METIRIRAIIFQDAGFWCAQCLEHDIAVQAHTKDALAAELFTALAAYAETAIEDGRKPFDGIPAAPRQFFEKFEKSREWNRRGPSQQPEAVQIVPTLRLFEPNLASR